MNGYVTILLFAVVAVVNFCFRYDSRIGQFGASIAANVMLGTYVTAATDPDGSYNYFEWQSVLENLILSVWSFVVAFLIPVYAVSCIIPTMLPMTTTDKTTKRGSVTMSKATLQRTETEKRKKSSVMEQEDMRLARSPASSREVEHTILRLISSCAELFEIFEVSLAKQTLPGGSALHVEGLGAMHELRIEQRRMTDALDRCMYERLFSDGPFSTQGHRPTSAVNALAEKAVETARRAACLLLTFKSPERAPDSMDTVVKFFLEVREEALGVDFVTRLQTERMSGSNTQIIKFSCMRGWLCPFTHLRTSGYSTAY